MDSFIKLGLIFLIYLAINILIGFKLGKTNPSLAHFSITSLNVGTLYITLLVY